jgi:hypothetical protein
MSEHHPEETMAFVAPDVDCRDLPDELIDELLAGARTPEEITGPDGLLQRWTERLVDRAMAAELTGVGPKYWIRASEPINWDPQASTAE